MSIAMCQEATRDQWQQRISMSSCHCRDITIFVGNPAPQDEEKPIFALVNEKVMCDEKDHVTTKNSAFILSVLLCQVPRCFHV
jgi:hypothetical protein